MVAAPIFGYLGDRFNRKVILSCGIFFWSAVTFSSSFITEQVRYLQRHLAGCPEILDNMFLKTPRDTVLEWKVSIPRVCVGHMVCCAVWPLVVEV